MIIVIIGAIASVGQLLMMASLARALDERYKNGSEEILR